MIISCSQYLQYSCLISILRRYYSTGTVTVANIGGEAKWVPSPDAECHPTTCGTGTAEADEGVVTPSGGSEVQVSGFTFMDDVSQACFLPLVVCTLLIEPGLLLLHLHG